LVVEMGVEVASSAMGRLVVGGSALEIAS
jgi:hypothetical protein